MSGTVPDTHAYLCTGCPLGCRLEVDAVEDDILEIRGFECKIGERYAKQEHSDPRRPVSTTVAIDGAYLPRLPVATAESFPKEHLLELAATLRDVRVDAPVERGEVILADALGTGIDVVATRRMDAVREPAAA